MTIEYQICMATVQTVGQKVSLESGEWICVEDSVFIGWTIESQIPVIRGPDDNPMINKGQYVKASHFKTFPKSGQTRTEIMILAEYERVSPEDLAKRTIAYSNWNTESFTIIFADKTYVKIEPEHDYDGLELSNNDLSIWDLRSLGVLNQDEFDAYQEECRAERKRQKNKTAVQDFHNIVRRVGKERAKELLGGD